MNCLKISSTRYVQALGESNSGVLCHLGINNAYLYLLCQVNLEGLDLANLLSISHHHLM